MFFVLASFMPWLNPVLAQISGSQLKALRFRQPGSSSSSNILLMVLFVLAIVLLCLLLRSTLRSHRIGAASGKIGKSQQRRILEELHLEDDDMQTLTTLAGGNTPNKLMPMLQSRIIYEDAVSLFRTQNPSDPILRRTPRLRQLLNYGFANPRNPFNDTRLLAPGLIIQVRIPLKSRQVRFVSRIMAVWEHQWLIRAPTAKGKPVNLTSIEGLILRISRENDAEYEFGVKLLGQSTGNLHTLALSHTATIQRLQFRAAKRVETTLNAKFHVLSDSYNTGTSRITKTSRDANYLFLGEMHDLSAGGALVTVSTGQRLPEVGQMMLFTLPEASISEDIVTQLVRVSQSTESDTQNLHLEFVGLPEHNRLKLARYIETLTSGT